jgi:hypothetical protein
MKKEFIPMQMGVWYLFDTGIYVGKMPYKEYKKIPMWITQRSLTRAQKKSVLDYLQRLFPTHKIVIIGHLLEDDEWEGVEYKADSEWLIDSNTRRYLWELGQTDEVPENLLVVRLDGKTLEEIRDIYWTIDNPSAAEQAAEVVTGIFRSMKVTPLTPKFQKGGIVTALSFLCKYHDPETFGEMGLWSNPDEDDEDISKNTHKRSLTQLAVQTYKDAIVALDKHFHKCGFDKTIDQAMICAYLFHYVKHGEYNENIELLTSLITENHTDVNGEIEIPMTPNRKVNLNAASWIYRENTKESYTKEILDRGKRDGYPKGVAFFCYWLNTAATKGLGYKQKQAPRGGYLEWFDTYKKQEDLGLEYDYDYLDAA